MSTARDVVEAVYAQFAADDLPRMRHLLADDVRWRQAAVGVPAAGEDAVGADALIERVAQAIRVEWTEFTEDVEELVAADEVVTATGTYRGRHRDSSRSLAAEFCHLWTVEDGKVRRFRQYTDTAAFTAVREHCGEGRGSGGHAPAGGVGGRT